MLECELMFGQHLRYLQCKIELDFWNGSTAHALLMDWNAGMTLLLEYNPGMAGVLTPAAPQYSAASPHGCACGASQAVPGQ